MRCVTRFALSVGSALVLLWSARASADQFLSCSDAWNSGYNTIRYMVSATYNKAACDRDRATAYEETLIANLPPYLASMDTTPSKSVCLFQGGYQGWIDTMGAEYLDCPGVSGFEGLPRKTVGAIASAMFAALNGDVPGYLTPLTVTLTFSYASDVASTGTIGECVARVRSDLVSADRALVDALVSAVCQ